MHMPSSRIASQHHHPELVDSSFLHEERAGSGLSVDGSLFQGKDRSGHYRHDVSLLGRTERVRPGLEDSHRAGNSHWLADSDLSWRYGDIVERGRQIFQEWFIASFAVSEG